MGKRKSAKVKAPSRRIPKLDKEFNCPFCSHTKSVGVKLDRVRSVGTLLCRVCGASFAKEINRLEESIDVYSEWIDACVDANAQAAKEAQERLEHHDHSSIPLNKTGRFEGVNSHREESSEGEDGAIYERDFPNRDQRAFRKPYRGEGESKLGYNSKAQDEDNSEINPSPLKRLRRDREEVDRVEEISSKSTGRDAEDVLAMYRQENQGDDDDRNASSNYLFDDDD